MTVGFYRNGQLDMDQVNHHVRLALDRLRRYDNKGNRDRRVNVSAGEPGPSRNGRRAPAFNPFKVSPKKSTTTLIPAATIQPNASVPTAVAATPPSVAVNTPTPTMTPVTHATTSTSTQARKAPVARRKDKKKADEDTAMEDDTEA
jgi:hypothetical protein